MLCRIAGAALCGVSRLVREVLHAMFELWHLAELDLLDPETTYALESTGQGLQRVQCAAGPGGHAGAQFRERVTITSHHLVATFSRSLLRQS